MTNRILILFAHPALEKSRVNRMLIEGLRDREGMTFHDLYEAYPDFDIDVAREQELLLTHDLIVMQHPFYWYSTPAMLKEWIDLVLEHGWAYGSGGKALRGKALLNAMTCGGGEASYTRDGTNQYTVRDFLLPIQQTARLCGMDYLPPFLVYGTHRLSEDDIRERAADYHAALEALRDGRVDRADAGRHADMNGYLVRQND